MPHRLRPYLIGLLSAIVLLVAAPLASAASCNTTEIYNQAYRGKITGHFSQACLRQAIRDETDEMKTYSNVDAVINSALLTNSFVHKYNKSNRNQVQPTQSTDDGSSVAPSGGSSGGGSAPLSRGGSSSQIISPPSQPTSVVSRALASAAPAKADDIPGPIILLGVLTGLFVLGGLGSYLLRRRLNARSASLPTA